MTDLIETGKNLFEGLDQKALEHLRKVERITVDRVERDTSVTMEIRGFDKDGRRKILEGTLIFDESPRINVEFIVNGRPLP